LKTANLTGKRLAMMLTYNIENWKP
jgi:hypothetical protein